MILCLDIGNTHIFGGVFIEDELLLQFRYPSTMSSTSDQLGIFFRQVLRENNIDILKLTKISISSVVPSLDYSLRSAIVKYFSIEPFFLKAGVKTGIKISYKNPLEVGSDRISTAIAAVQQFPSHHIIVVDLGTATTFDIITKDQDYVGGIIMPGLNIAMKALHENTAKLPPVNILKPLNIVGKTTVTNIQSGLYYGHLGAMNEIIRSIKKEVFKKTIDSENVVVLGTGGFSSLFETENIFTAIVPDLVLHGLKIAWEKNNDTEK